ncbi:bifunctional UDP-sugar hydrolase/5'-nucleotidase UshA [Psychromonas antarctica]|jgi:5'-nucleotidase/UDP-sugar diphosphatase|uniref:bifunctional UDP-sugar hydrolase/5'-nucleotidase UshA n=1 Tax=Psychromonas antarctica TaxID=67573 RepID=UPI001EE838B2|nr:bifunctional UDP-sugar hydrolase/5'-nucleotidase UshA [Psychromonas antarctica]MCG6201193.1 bifunctional UDP-sugar hydrolase/5'-nucleotidase UshA [Psychromonas antarctica]
MIYKNFILTSLALVMVAACSTETAQHQWVKDKEYQITVLHTNDNHGHFWENKYGELGMAARATLINKIRTEVESKGGSVLLLSGGDINTGVPESDLQDAEPDFIGMNMIAYDAMAIGNHEFDNSLDVLAKQEGWAEFPFLAANIYKDGKRMFDAYKIFNKDGVKIAVIGLTTEDTADIGNPEYIKQVEFRDPKAEAKIVIAELKAKHNPDIIIAATHMGHYLNGNNGSNAPGDVQLARYLNEGDLDMIVGGHSQEPVCMEGINQYAKFKPGDDCQPDQQNGTYIVQAHEWGKYVGRADYTFKNGLFTMQSYNLIPVNLKKSTKNAEGEKIRVLIQSEIAQDKAVFDTLKPFQDKGQAALSVLIGSTNGLLEGERKIVRNKQTNLGRLIATAHMQRAKADFAIMNSGGVRASIEAGDISYKDVLTVQPFANMVTYVDMTGEEVINYLNVVATKSKDSGAYAQFAGISMTVANNQVSNVMIAGKALQATATYRFTIPSFNAAGGDGYPNISEHPAYVNTGYVDAEVLKEYIQKNSPINVADFAPKNEIIYQ